MRDMLERLQTISEELEDYEPQSCGPEYDENKATLSQQAVMFENSSAIDNVLREAHSIRKEISLLHLDVKRLSTHNERFGTSVRRLTLLKKDSDSIARGIYQRGEALFNRLHVLSRESSQLEEKEGPDSAVSRIARVQFDALSRALQDVMSDYSNAEEMQRRACRQRIQRQASIMGTEITNERLDTMVHQGGEGWTELSQSLLTKGARSSGWAMNEIRGRHKELMELEARLKDIHEMFLQMAMLVEDQGYMLNDIEANVCGTKEYVEKMNVHIKKAIKYKRTNPFLQCCSCLPCWEHNQTF